MRFLNIFLLISLLNNVACKNSNSSTPAQEAVASKYDTIEIQYEKLSEVAYDLIDNISVDETMPVKPLEELLENIPTVSFDFKNVPATRVDIRIFVQHQSKIESEITRVFSILDSSAAWKDAPLIQELKKRFQTSEQEVAVARSAYDKAVGEAKLDMKIVPAKLPNSARTN